MRVGIVGLGLIGGSLGLDWRSRGHEVLGVSQREATCERAIARGAVNSASCQLASLAAAEVVVLCVPLAALVETARDLIPLLPPETILTDAGSVKGPIVGAIAPDWPNFVGGHPMAGTAESGIEAALPGLFVDRPYVLTPQPSTPARAIATLEALIQDLGAVAYHTSPEAHDRAVAWISHLPVVVSASLLAACGQEPSGELRALAESLASSGFADTTRVGGGNPNLGLMMAHYNRPELLRALRFYRESLDAVIEEIDRQDWSALARRYQATQAARRKFL